MKTHPLAAQVLGFILGINKHYANATVMLDGKSYTAAALVQMFQELGDAAARATQADVERTTAAKVAATLAEQVAPVASAFKKAVLAAYGGDPTALADFQLDPPKPAVKSTEVLSAAAKKAAVTRKALGTMGAKQKKLAKKQLASQAPAAEPAPASPPAPAAVPPAKS